MNLELSTSLWHPVVMRFDEWHLRNSSLLHLVTDLYHDLSSILMISSLHVSHSNGFLQTGTEGTRSDFTNKCLSSSIINLSMLTSRCLHSHDANSLSCGLLELSFRSKNVLGANEASLCTTTRLGPAHGPSKCPFSGSDRSIQIMPVEAESSLKTEGITGTKSGGVDGRIVQELGSNGNGIFRRHGNLKAILSRVPTSGNATPIDSIQGGICTSHKGHVCQIESIRQDFGHGLSGPRSLDGE
mmetsp:Transcript_21575/g.31500  ORF Transcript_21575/g.31500 Transcript_21575/m.31500 type:complete len:242 (+) Transcript_21575:174-899(+)